MVQHSAAILTLQLTWKTVSRKQCTCLILNSFIKKTGDVSSGKLQIFAFAIERIFLYGSYENPESSYLEQESYFKVLFKVMDKPMIIE